MILDDNKLFLDLSTAVGLLHVQYYPLRFSGVEI